MILKRKREGRTNYKKRLSLLKSKQLRLVVRKTNSQIILQLVQYLPDGDKVLATKTSNSLVKAGWKGSTNNLSGAYWTGYSLGKEMKGKKAILDIGLHKPHKAGRVYAAVKGAVDGGLVMNVGEEVLPSEDRIKASKNYAIVEKKLK